MPKAYKRDVRERTQSVSIPLHRHCDQLDLADKPPAAAALLTEILSWPGLG